MAIAFARMTIHSRSHGHSSVAGAAYRAGAKLYDERIGQTFDYENRKDVVYQNIMLPEGVDEKFKDRAFLWNAVEQSEKRKDAQVARDIILALPRDIDLNHQIELARNFAYTHFISKGLAADIAIHDNGTDNPHAHLYVTTRPLLKNNFSPKKYREPNKFGKGGFIKQQDEWNKKWRACQNDYFTNHHIGLIVDQDHIIPHVHEGRVRGKEAHYLKKLNQIHREASVEIAISEPENLLNILSTGQAVFSECDIASLVSKNTDTEEQYKTSYEKLTTHQDLIYLGLGEDGRKRYTSRANYLREAELGDRADALLCRKAHTVSLRTTEKIGKANGLTEEQTHALGHLAKSGDICALVGRAGTGKSFMMKAAKTMWEEAGFNVRGMAVAGIAAKNLEKETGILSTTVHSVKFQIAHDRLNLSNKDILVVDEAGMTDLNDMAIIVEAVKKAGAKLALIGDHAQLEPVGNGAPFRAVIERIGFAEMHTIMRQKDPADAAATRYLSQGDISKALDHYNSKDQVHFLETSQQALDTLIDDWQKTSRDAIITAFRNADVDLLNQKARQALLAKKRISADSHIISTAKGDIALSKGDRILFLLNNKALGIHNGQFASIESINGSHITAVLDDRTKITFNTSQYNHFSYGYAATVHKLQGATFDSVYVYADGKAWNKHLTYVALSRHKTLIHLYADKETHQNLNELKIHLGRENFRDSVLDWALSFAIRRGLDPDSLAGRCVDKIAGIGKAIKDAWLFIVNYEAYFLQKQYCQQLKHSVIRRKEAKKVARFIDMHRFLGRKWSELKTAESIYKHPDYSDTYQQMLAKNKLGYELYQEGDKFTAAFKANRISLETVQKAAEAHVRYENVRSYITDFRQGRVVHCRKSAHLICQDIKVYYSHLMYLSDKQERKEMMQMLKKDALDYKRRQYLLSGKDSAGFKLVDRYNQETQALKRIWALVYAYGGVEHLSQTQLMAYSRKSWKCDQLAYEICKHPVRYKDLLTLYALDLDTLKQFSDKHQKRIKVAELSETSHVYKREELAADILADRRYYRHVYEFDLDWKSLYKDRHAFNHKQKLLTLPEDKLAAYRLVCRYNQARIHTGIAWSRLIRDKADGKAACDARQKFCWKLLETRNALAYEIALDPKKYRQFLGETNIKTSDLEKHAVAYSKSLQRLAAWRQKKSRKLPRQYVQKIQASSENRLDYQTVNNALLNMGEEFYTRLLGDSGKKSGGCIRYGKKGSLSVTLQGRHAGNWYSFETGEGGAPIQLLMNTTHGWGLGYQNALQEGARFAGLSLSSPIYTSPKKLTDKKHLEKEDLEDKKRRIAAARYYYNSAVDIHGTLGETYLRQIRGIVGDISVFRYHPRVRDDRQIGSTCTTTYHPALIAAARDKNGEITAVQTILLNPVTAEKVDKETVGAVKRSRGVVKGSAVQIQSGKGRVIIAEGLETAASLFEVEPAANIYVTLGNIKNAASLGWLSEKHQTKTLYFAADNDGEGANNVKLLKEAAAVLKHEYGIDCYMALPYLPGYKKCDFNDILLEQGAEAVKEQFSAMQLIEVSQRKEIIQEKVIRERLQVLQTANYRDKSPLTLLSDKQLEWESLNAIDDIKAQYIYRNYKAALEKTTDNAKLRVYQTILDIVKTAVQRPDTVEKLKIAAPNLVCCFEQLTAPAKKRHIDYQNDILPKQWQQLEKMRDIPLVGCLVRNYKLLEQKQEPSALKRIYKTMNDVVEKIVKNKPVLDRINKVLPQISSLFKNHVQPRVQTRGRSR